jgi:glycosyltransferase involved in cell wall biosynthesis
MAMAEPLVSIVVTTRNEEAHLEHCLRSIVAQTWRHRIELIVVDNFSTDRTREIALRYTPKVHQRGPERSAQRNFGMREVASGQMVAFFDADMILTPSLIEQAVRAMEAQRLVGLYLPEVVLGRSLLARIRRFERSFYDGTVIDAARLFLRKAFLAAGGFDEALFAGEDWDLDRRIRQVGRVGILHAESAPMAEELDRFVTGRGVLSAAGAAVVYHDESEMTWRRYLAKKMYYSNGLREYADKWGANDPEIRKQLGPAYRLVGVFVENGKWVRLVRNPLLATGLLVCRGMVGAGYVTRRML